MALVLLLGNVVDLFSKTIVLTRNENQPERFMIDVPDKWPVALEPFGTDFIIHNMIVTNPEGDETLRLGWLADPVAPQRITDEMAESFKSQIDYWLTEHQLTGKIHAVQELTLGDKEARSFQLELIEEGNKSLVDYYLILGENSVYVISVSHAIDAKLDDINEALKSICVKNEVFAKLLPPPIDPDDPDDPKIKPTPVKHGSKDPTASSSTFSAMVLPGNEDDQIVFILKIGAIIVVVGGGLLFIMAGFVKAH